MNLKKNSFIGTTSKTILNLLALGAEKSEHQIIPFSVFSIIGFVLFYFLNTMTTPQAYENFGLRLLAAFMCIPLILKNHWPQKIQKFFPLYWYICLLFFLPFFFFFMALKNNLSPAWQVYMVQLLFFLALIVDWISLIVLIPIGFALAYFVYLLTTYHPVHIYDQDFSFIALGFSVLLIALFSRNNQVIEREKIDAMKSVSSNIAHELRTPLRTITSSVQGIKNYLPRLLTTYQLAKEHQLPVAYISPSHVEGLLMACENIESEAKASFTVIDMLLVNVSQHYSLSHEFKEFSVNECVNLAISRYPYDMGEVDLVHWINKVDFTFFGDQLLLVHILFNLFKNSFYFIKHSGKGEVYIWNEINKNYNELHFKDTAQGISKKSLSHIFDRFYSDTLHGAGVGLAFCKMVMQSFDGDIKCFSEEGDFAEFVLYFPRAKIK